MLLDNLLQQYLTKGQYKYVKNTGFLKDYMNCDVCLVKEQLKLMVENRLLNNPLLTMRDHPCLHMYKALYRANVYENEENILPNYHTTGHTFQSWLQENLTYPVVKKFYNSRYLQIDWDKPFGKVILILCEKIKKLYKDEEFSKNHRLFPLFNLFSILNLIPNEIKNIVKEPNTVKQDAVTLKINSLKGSAKKRNIRFSLSYKDIEKLLNTKRCYYTGIRFNNKIPSRKRTIDRIDNTKGYEKGNVVACTDKANQMKMHLFESQSALTYKQIQSLISKVEKRLLNN